MEVYKLILDADYKPTYTIDFKRSHVSISELSRGIIDHESLIEKGLYYEGKLSSELIILTVNSYAINEHNLEDIKVIKGLNLYKIKLTNIVSGEENVSYQVMVPDTISEDVLDNARSEIETVDLPDGRTIKMYDSYTFKHKAVQNSGLSVFVVPSVTPGIFVTSPGKQYFSKFNFFEFKQVDLS